MIAEWWTSLSVLLKILWGITLASSLVFIIETIMTFIGADAGDTGLDGVDTDFDGPDNAMDGVDGTSGMNLYTFRNFVNFFLGFGWTSVLLYEQIASKALLFALAFLVGVVLVAIVMYLFKWLSTMQQSGNINVWKSAVGCHGKVYLTIPGERAGVGKVQITINNAVREYDALTDGETLRTGAAVKVVEVIDASTLLVEEMNSLII